MPTGGTRVLLVDDDPIVGIEYTRMLERAGFVVELERDAPEACARLERDVFDVVITDHAMPRGTGFDVLAAAHAADPSLPVVFVTGASDLDLAERALDDGALRFLVKPVSPEKLRTAAAEAGRARLAASGRHALTREFEGDLHEVVLGRLLTSAIARVWIARQPVVSLSARRVVGYEALLRSDEPELSRPDQILAAAERLGRIHELGRRVRAATAALLGDQPPGVDMLVNLHPSDLEDPELYDPDAPLSHAAERIVLEITERASFEQIDRLNDRLDGLRRLGYRIAVDDLGAGYASLSALAVLRPDLVKIDMSLIRGVDADPVRRRIVESVGAMCRRLGTSWLCEGVETQAELAAVAAAGADLVQGYYLGRPTRSIASLDLSWLGNLRPARSSRTSQLATVTSAVAALCAEIDEIAASLRTIPEANAVGRRLENLIKSVTLVLADD